MIVAAPWRKEGLSSHFVLTWSRTFRSENGEPIYAIISKEMQYRILRLMGPG